MKQGIILLVSAAIFCCTGFEKKIKPASSSGADSLRFTVPANFPAPVYQFTNNPLTKEGFALGKRLFYDTLLSKDRSISCGNCHQSFAAFANLDHATSHGVDFCFGNRNAPALFNLAWQKEFMWDGGVKHIEFSPLNALTSSCEMANSLDTIVQRLKNSKVYPPLFTAAFGSSEINSQRLLRAFAQFTAMLVSANSKYDKHARNEPGGNFTREEEEGYAVFKQYCNRCHTEPLFTDLSYRSNGLDVISDDPGRDTITSNEADRGKFRVPSLRNIFFSSPYMHDGRLNTVEEVLTHYTSGIKKSPVLDAAFTQANGKTGLTFTAADKRKLLLFLQTLSDTAFVKDTRFAE